MTSATGSAMTRCDAVEQRGGFTLIELMVVIMILTILMGLLVVVGTSMRHKARTTSTQSLIDKIALTAQNYRSKVGVFPSDGINDDVITDEGTSLQSGAALAYALTRPLKLKTKLPGGKVKVTEEKAVGSDFGEKDLFVDPDDPDAVEFIDGWGNSLHYDNISGSDSFDEQNDAEFHLQECEDHGEDPREDPEIVENTGPQNSNEYDVWSHGPNGHTEEEDILLVLANFTVKTQEDQGEED